VTRIPDLHLDARIPIPSVGEGCLEAEHPSLGHGLEGVGQQVDKCPVEHVRIRLHPIRPVR